MTATVIPLRQPEREEVPRIPPLNDSTLIAAYLATRDDSILAELELRAIHRERK